MNASRDLDTRFSEFVATGDSAPLGDVFDATADDLYRLALHLCGALATAEGGTLTLTNPGPGPCFTLRLPTTERNE